MRVLVIGKNGQIARSICALEENYEDINIFYAARTEGDVFIDLSDENTICAAVLSIEPQIIINAAAYTDVDKAEDEPEVALQINGIAVGVLAQTAEKIGAILIHISTDYVFDGKLNRPYRVEDEPNPVSAYGRSKLAGEIATREASDKHIIVRTAWVYSPYGKNFYKTMLNLAQTRKKLSVVDDQIGNPTPASLVSTGLLDLCEQIRNGNTAILGKIFHMVGPEEMTWCGFARKIFLDNNLVCFVEPISTSDYPVKATRPRNSLLAVSELNFSSP